MAALAGVGVLAGPALPAQAASGDSGTVTPTEERNCLDSRCGVIRNPAGGTRMPVICFRDAGSAYGTNRWFRISYAGGTGWVNANRMSRQPAVPYCGDTASGRDAVGGADDRVR